MFCVIENLFNFKYTFLFFILEILWILTRQVVVLTFRQIIDKVSNNEGWCHNEEIRADAVENVGQTFANRSSKRTLLKWR